MNRPLAIILGLTLLVAGGLVHGHYADRWQKSSALEDAVAKLPTVPLTFDGWMGEDQPTDHAEYAQAGAQGYWSRSYQKNGKEFLVILMAGRAGRMAVHTPEVCYRGAGFELNGDPKLVTARSSSGGELGSFWSATFVKPAAVNAELQLAWGWSDGDRWSAPARPRLAFLGKPSLFKLYLSQNVSGLTSDVAVKNREEFLRAFLPVLSQSLEIQ